MMQIIDDILQAFPILHHEYILGLYGVILWEIEQYIAKKDHKLKDCIKGISRSLIWVGGIVVFDDELLARYNHFAEIDYKHPPFWLYITAGFAIDIIRSYYTKDKEK